MEESTARIAEDAPALDRLLERSPATVRKALIWVLLQALVILPTQVVAESRDHSATRVEVEQAIQHTDVFIHNEMQRAVEEALNDYRLRQDVLPPVRIERESNPGRNAPCSRGVVR
jgi:hypothetical protein